MVAGIKAGRNAWSCALNANVGRQFVVAGDKAGKMPALHGLEAGTGMSATIRGRQG